VCIQVEIQPHCGQRSAGARIGRGQAPPAVVEQETSIRCPGQVSNPPLQKALPQLGVEHDSRSSMRAADDVQNDLLNLDAVGQLGGRLTGSVNAALVQSEDDLSF
jgi:hypothetical protein